MGDVEFPQQYVQIRVTDERTKAWMEKTFLMVEVPANAYHDAIGQLSDHELLDLSDLGDPLSRPDWWSQERVRFYDFMQKGTLVLRRMVRELCSDMVADWRERAGRAKGAGQASGDARRAKADALELELCALLDRWVWKDTRTADVPARLITVMEKNGHPVPEHVRDAVGRAKWFQGVVRRWKRIPMNTVHGSENSK